MSPFFLFTYPPFVDVPQHLATLSVLKGMDDPSTGYAEKFIVEWFPNTNVGFFGVAHFLGRFMTLLWAVKMCILFYIVGLVVALIWLHRLVHGRNESPPWAFLLIFPFLYNSSLLLGLINYCMSLSLFFLWLCITLDGLGHFSWKHCLCHALLLLALFIFHSQTYLFAGLCSAFFFFLLAGLKNRLWFSIGWVPSITLFFMWYRHKFAFSSGKLSFAGLQQGFGSEFVPFIGNLQSIVANTIGFSRFVWWDKAILIMIAMILWWWRPDAKLFRDQCASAIWGVIVLSVLCYFLLPLNIKLQFYISARLLIIGCILCVVLFSGYIPRLPSRPLIIACVLLPVVFYIKWLPFYQRVNTSWNEATQLLRQVPSHAKVLGFPFLQFEFEEGNQEENYPTHLHVASLFLLAKTGEVASNFMILPSSPVRYRYPENENIIVPDVRANVKPWCAMLSGGWGNDSDFILSMGTGAGLMPWWVEKGMLKYVDGKGSWFLYKRIGDLTLTENELQEWWIPLTCNKRLDVLPNFLDIFRVDTSRNRKYDATIGWWRERYGIR